MKQALRHWYRKEEGSTAVEFAIVGIPFILMLIGIIEISLMLVTGALLQDATSEASRLIRTGQAQQSAGGPEDVFVTELCRVAGVFLNCENIQYEVVTLPGGFSEAETTPPIYDQNGDLVPRGFDAGGADDVVLIRTTYRYPLVTPMFGALMGQNRLMTTTIVLQTEPYAFEAG